MINDLTSNQQSPLTRNDIHEQAASEDCTLTDET